MAKMSKPRSIELSIDFEPVTFNEPIFSKPATVEMAEGYLDSIRIK